MSRPEFHADVSLMRVKTSTPHENGGALFPPRRLLALLPLLGLLSINSIQSAETTSLQTKTNGGTKPVLLDDRFELSPGFHVYRAAGPELTGGSYDLAFDGDGRLLVGDGNAIRRLQDTDGDGVFDQFDVVATGLGWRGPQGLLVEGDRLYAVGGDGLQWYEGYLTGRLIHRGRLGARFNTGGDHDLHTVFRGYDGWLYLMAGNGAGIAGRRHITETNSPVRQEREASVFRLDPEGRRWECIAAGGRNPPGLGMNYVGDLFSFDSDMEWHVGLPFYKPVRLHHWAVGTDQGWQEVGAFPSYYLDAVPPVYEAGRGSPNWGVFYEHHQFPGRYLHAFINCDYRWKRESDDQYATSGRLVAFVLERAGAGWRARMDTLIRPKPGARDAQDRPINFALVDVEVAPDGSLIVSDHNQGLWRIFYGTCAPKGTIPKLWPGKKVIPTERQSLLREMLEQPQPLAAWSRQHRERLRQAYGDEEILTQDLQRVALLSSRSMEHRIRAIQLLASGYTNLHRDWLQDLRDDRSPEIRGHAAWLHGLRNRPDDEQALRKLTEDESPLVRRRAVEGLTRSSSPRSIPTLVTLLADDSRLIRSIAMNALGRFPWDEWARRAQRHPSRQVRLRALAGAKVSGQTVPAKQFRQTLTGLLTDWSMPGAPPPKVEDSLDLLRVLALYESEVSADPGLRAAVVRHLRQGFPAGDRNLRWEQVRLLGLYRVSESFGSLLDLLEAEQDHVTQFHLGQSLARLADGWTQAEAERATAWFLSTQRGWFADLASKGVEFPQFWSTTIAEFASHHPEAMLQQTARVDPASAFGGAFLDLLTTRDPSGQSLKDFYGRQTNEAARARVALSFRRVARPEVANFLRDEAGRSTHSALQDALWQSLASQPVDEANVPWLLEGIRHGQTETARAGAQALAKYPLSPTTNGASACLERMIQDARVFHSVERVLTLISQKQRSDYQATVDVNRRPDERTREAAITFWKAWFRTEFGRPFVPAVAVTPPERTDAAIRDALMSDTMRGGDARRGGALYERLQCHTCHGGGAAPGREGRFFGPDLAGVTRRLSRAELVEALLEPSRQVADRFKAFELEQRDGTVLTGFVTERTDVAVTFADAQQVHRVPMDQIKHLAPQSRSLMPDRLLNTLTDEELRDLMGYLDQLGAGPP
jgi:putative heme-binding domain-containing protein